MTPQEIAAEFLDKRVELIPAFPLAFRARTGTLSDVGARRCYLNYGTPREFSAPWPIIKAIKEA